MSQQDVYLVEELEKIKKEDNFVWLESFKYILKLLLFFDWILKFTYVNFLFKLLRDSVYNLERGK